MSWPMQNPGQWTPGMAMAPDMNMGSYTPEQWAAMQQQNWQQWTQWQQQYAQWQSQYGEKYAEQMQAIQAMGGMPPLPPGNAAPPPAPPPPDKPPPPPHENNQPLYAHTPSQPAPVPAPSSNQHQNTNASINVTLNQQAGNNSNWSNTQESNLSTVNAEALKKLAEEERLFDIQFQKWEEEIEKWKKDNVNHPDKQAYKEYEQKFEACRAQLLERRQQMNKKKARLLGTAPPPPPPQPANTTASANVPPPLLSTPTNAFPNKQQQMYGSHPGINQNKPPQNYGNNTGPIQDKQQQNYGGNYSQHLMQQNQNYGHNPSQNYSNNAQNQYQQYPPNAYNRNSNNINMPSQDRYDSYSNTDKYPPKESFTVPPNNSFLLATESNKKGIPGLDLVPDADKSFGPKQDVIDITGESTQGLAKAPDYSTISKGINNILGDEKIMNILSMVRGQVPPPPANNLQTNQSNQRRNYGGNNQSNPMYDQEYRSQNYNNKPFDNGQNNMPYNRPDNNYSVQQTPEGLRHPPPKRMIDERQDEMQDSYKDYDRNAQYGGNDMNLPYDNGPPRAGPPPVRGNMSGPRPPIRPLIPELPGQQNDYPRGPPPPPSQQNVNDYPRGMQGPPERRPLHDNNINPIGRESVRPKWIDEPMFSPSLIVEYEHKPLRLKARDFIEPVHMFDYNHKSKDEDTRKKDFEKEADELFLRKPRRSEKESDYVPDRYSRDHYSRDYERRVPRDDLRAPRDDLRDEARPRLPFRDDYDDRRRLDDDRRRPDDDRRRPDDDRRRLDDDRRRLERYDDRKRDDRDKYTRRDDLYRERDRDFHRDRDRNREPRRDDLRRRSISHDRDSRKRGLSRDSDLSDTFSKRSREKENIPAAQFDQPKRIVMIDDLLEPPGRDMRPDKIVIILRGPPGSGKSYLAKLIRDKEAEYGGTVRIMSIDDYFMQEGEVEERDPATGKMVKKPTLKYEYEASSEEAYVSSLKRAFKRSLTDGYFTFLIYDAVNDTLRSYGDVWNLCRQFDFQVYICTMELDPQICYKRNIHNRSLEDIETISARFYPTPPHHIQLDATTLLQSGAITEVQMEDADDEVIMEDAQDPEVESVFTSKWEKMDDAAQLARLDGTSKPLRPSQLSMEDYLQLDDWKPTTAKPGKKTVRWADIEERRQQEKMRAIGFVVGQTDWNRMTDPTMGSSALTQTKYIERVRRH